MVEARTVLWYVTFCGFAVNYMIRINVNIALVSMVKTGVNDAAHSSECYTQVNASNSTRTMYTSEGMFAWDEREQSHVLGAFFWLHWVTQLPGGVLARHYGTKLVFGLSNLGACLLTLAMPAAAYWDYRALVGLRVAQGFVAGLAWPAMHHLTAVWIPPNERSKFVSAYLGSSVGVAMTYPLCGLIIDLFSWEAVFYTTAVIGITWFAVWCLLVFDSPAQHPRISEIERIYIQSSLGKSVSRRKMAIPWIAILTSQPLWMLVLAQWGGTWGLFTLMTQAPVYFNVILGWEIKMTGLWSGLPHLARWTFAFSFSLFADYLLRNNLLGRTNVRKLATFISTVVQGAFVLGLAYSGCNSLAAILFLIAATGVHGAVSTGPLSSLVDISPNFASILQGISGTFGNITGFVSAFIVGRLTYQNQTSGQWRKVFLLTAGMLAGTGSVYLIFGNSEIQPWNTPQPTKEEKLLNDDGKELKLPPVTH